MENIAERLDNINNTLKEISGKIPKPDHPFIRGMLIAGLGVSILAILQAVETIIKWIGG